MTNINFKKYINCSDSTERKLIDLYNICESGRLLDDFGLDAYISRYKGRIDDDDIALKLIFYFEYLISGEFECVVFNNHDIVALECTPDVEVFLIRDGFDYKYNVSINGVVIDEDLVSLYLEEGITPCIDIILREIGEQE